MVTVRRQPTEGELGHWRDWVAQLESRVPLRNREMLEQACERAEQCQLAGEAAGRKWPYGKGCLMESATPLTRSSYPAGDDFAKLRQARIEKLGQA